MVRQPESGAEYWIMWRRVAGGLSLQLQNALYSRLRAVLMPGHAQCFPRATSATPLANRNLGPTSDAPVTGGPMTGNEPLDHPLPAQPAIGVKKGPCAQYSARPYCAHPWAFPLHYSRFSCLGYAA